MDFLSKVIHLCFTLSCVSSTLIVVTTPSTKPTAPAPIAVIASRSYMLIIYPPALIPIGPNCPYTNLRYLRLVIVNCRHLGLCTIPNPLAIFLETLYCRLLYSDANRSAFLLIDFIISTSSFLETQYHDTLVYAMLVCSLICQLANLGQPPCLIAYLTFHG